MESKYYTPTIEEFHEGFEFEVPMYGSDLYSKEIFSINSIQHIFNRDSDGDYFIPDNFRVKLLDREDIESTIFNYGNEIKESGSHIYYANVNDMRTNGIKSYYLTISAIGWVLIYYTDKLKPDNTLENIVRFSGFIKNKSELQKLMSQLDIK